MTRYKTAANLLACLILTVATLRAFTFWAADPMLAYANNFDQIRTLRTFGLHPKDSPKELYAGTPEQPWRYFIRADQWHAPTYPSSDLLIKSIQYAAMAALADDDGAMDIKVATLPVLLGWLLGIWLIFRKLAARPLAALGFAGWILLVADPINLLFLNTWYAEFSAFAIATLFVGMAWLWLFQLLSLRAALVWGAVCLFILSLNRNQYMFLLPAAALLTGAALALSHSHRQQWMVSPVKLALVTAACLLPMLVYSAAAKHIHMATSANRIDTVFGALLPASKNPARMLKHMELPPECLQFSGQTWYTRPATEYQAHCPQIMKLSLVKIAKAVALDPAPLAEIIGNIGQRHRSFLQHHIGQVEGTKHAQIGSDTKPYHQSLDPLIQRLSAGTTILLIWLAALGPALAALAAWALRQPRWIFMFLLSGLLFDYTLFSSILGDGYFDLERHAVLCFSFGALFFVLLVSFAVNSMILRSPIARESLISPEIA